MYQVLLTDHAKMNLADLKRHGRKTLAQLRALLEELRYDPLGMTQPLHVPLQQYRSLHSGRFRVIIKISDRKVHIVYVLAIGWHESGSRHDIYQNLQRALKSGVIKLPPDPGN